MFPYIRSKLKELSYTIVLQFSMKHSQHYTFLIYSYSSVQIRLKRNDLMLMLNNKDPCSEKNYLTQLRVFRILILPPIIRFYRLCILNDANKL